MAQLDPSQRHIEVSKSEGMESSSDIKVQKSQTSPTFQQLIQGEASVWSPTASPKLRKNNNHEEDHHNRKSVIMKVKERAKKLHHSLSGKKQHHQSSDNSTPSWGVRLEDYEVEEEDPEYLGAPMYESELAPENYKETARQHPREVHGMPSEKHVIEEEEEEEQYHSPKQGNEEHSIPKKTITETVSDRLGPTYAAVSETVSEKLAPAYAAVSDATHDVANKIACLTISTPQGPGTGTDNTQNGSNANASSSPSLVSTAKGNPSSNSSVSPTNVSITKKSPSSHTSKNKTKASSRTSHSPTNASTMRASSLPHTHVDTTNSTRQVNSKRSLSAHAPISTTYAKSSIQNPSSAYVTEAIEEENQGRILQAN